MYFLGVERIIKLGLYQCLLSFFKELLLPGGDQSNIAARTLSEQVEKVLLEIHYY